MKRILLLNGPNLNLLGKREPEIYGNLSFEEWFEQIKGKFAGVQLVYKQSNVEGELINIIHEHGFDFDGIVFNPGAYTHTSIALGDAIKAVSTPVIEVHISNVHSREDFRHISYITPCALGCITGLGLTGYELAIRWFLNQQ